MAKYHSFNIEEGKEFGTDNVWYELNHWFVSDRNPDLLGRRSLGYYKTKEEAIEVHEAYLKSYAAKARFGGEEI